MIPTLIPQAARDYLSALVEDMAAEDAKPTHLRDSRVYAAAYSAGQMLALVLGVTVADASTVHPAAVETLASGAYQPSKDTLIVVATPDGITQVIGGTGKAVSLDPDNIPDPAPLDVLDQLFTAVR